MGYYIDGHNCEMSDNQVGFLVSRYHANSGVDVVELTRAPGRTNLSCQPRMEGWLGETNNVSRSALGLARVVRTFKNGRHLVVEVTDPAEIEAALEQLGWPDLSEEVEAAR